MQERDSRHLYDIAKLLTVIKLDDSLKPLIRKVRKDRLKLKNNLSAQSQYDINEILDKIITDRFYETDYNSLTTKLLYEIIAYDEAIENGIRIIANRKIFSMN